jgi:hypothetical protein
MDYETFFALLGGLLPFIAGLIAGSNWLNSRFEKVNREIAELRSQGELLEYRCHANQELIEHRTQRFKGADDRLQYEIDQVKGYLEKHGFQRRERGRDDE